MTCQGSRLPCAAGITTLPSVAKRVQAGALHRLGHAHEQQAEDRRMLQGGCRGTDSSTSHGFSGCCKQQERHQKQRGARRANRGLPSQRARILSRGRGRWRPPVREKGILRALIPECTEKTAKTQQQLGAPRKTTAAASTWSAGNLTTTTTWEAQAVRRRGRQVRRNQVVMCSFLGKI